MSQRVLKPSLSDGRPPMLMLTMSAPSRTIWIMPSVRACVVQPVLNRQARDERIFAPGAWPLIAPPNSLLPDAMPATCEPCAPATMPMLTYTFSTAGSPTVRLAVWTTNGTVSFTAVAGLSVPNVSMSKFFAYGRFPASSAKLRS